MTNFAPKSESGILLPEPFDPVVAEEREKQPDAHTPANRLRLLWDERRLLFRLALWGLLISTAIAFLVPKRYSSTTQLMPPDQDNGLGMGMFAALAGKTGGLGTLGSSLLGLKSSGALFVGVLRSETVEDDLVAEFDLRKVYGVSYVQDARRILAQQTEVGEDRKSGIITIKVTDKSPERAAEMARAYVKALNDVVVSSNTSSAHRERVFLEGRLEQVKQSLENAERQFGEFASKNTAIDIKEQGRAMLDAAARLQGELIASESELQGLRQIYTNNNVRIRSLSARVAELRSQLQKLGGNVEAPGPAAAVGGGSQYPSIRRLPLLGIPYADLYRRMKTEEAVYETLTQEYEMAKVQEAKETPSVKVLDPASVPQKKSYPPRLLIMCLGSCLALGLGLTWVFGRALWEETHAEDPRKLLALEVFETARAGLSRVSQNSSRLASVRKKVLGSLNGRRKAAKKQG